MPKKQEKTVQEITAEEYFPVDEDDLRETTEKEVVEKAPKEDILKKSIEKPVKVTPDVEEVVKGSVEKEYKKPSKKETEKVKKPRKKRKTTKKGRIVRAKYKAPKINLKDNGYELIITEKPQAALKIASALGDITERNSNKVSYYEVERDGKKIVIRIE